MEIGFVRKTGEAFLAEGKLLGVIVDVLKWHCALFLIIPFAFIPLIFPCLPELKHINIVIL